MYETIVLLSIIMFFYYRTIFHNLLIDDQLTPKGIDKNPIKYFFNHLLARKYSSVKFAKVQRLAVHWVNCCLIYYAFGANEISFVAALIFAVNPCNLNGVAWLNGIGYSLCGTCALLMVLNEHYMIFPYLLTLWLHVVSFTSPVFVMLNDFSLLNALYATFSLVCYIVIAKSVGFNVPIGKVQSNATMMSRWKEVHGSRFRAIDFRKCVFAVRTYSFYFWKGLFPMRLGLYPDFGYAYGIIKRETEQLEKLDLRFMFDFLTLVGNLFCILHFWGAPLSTGLLWWNVFIMPFCNIIILQQTIADRYCYVPNIGLALAAVGAIDYIPNAEILAALYMGMLATKLWLFLPAYKTMDTLIDYNLHDYPRSEAAWNWKGVLENVAKRFFSAIHYWGIGLRCEPESFRLNYNISQAYARMAERTTGQSKEFYKATAKIYFDQAQKGLSEEAVKYHENELDKQEADFKKRMNVPVQSRQQFNF